jgi:hypothetical protein
MRFKGRLKGGEGKRALKPHSDAFDPKLRRVRANRTKVIIRR